MAEWLQVFGALGDGVAGIASVLAFAAAAVAVVFSARTLRIERERERKAARREEREQAALISAWCATRTDSRHHSGRSFRGLIVRNASHAPAYDMRIESSYAQRVRDDATAIKPMKIAIVPPGEFYIPEGEDNFAWGFPESLDGLDYGVKAVMNNRKWAVTSLDFTDSHGERWRRDELGRLFPSRA